MLRLLLLLIMFFLAASIVAVIYLPLWQVAIIGVVLLIILRYVGGYLLKQAFLIPFKAKGRVLRNAQVDVHSVAPAAAPPKSEDESDAEKKPGNYYLLDISIKPQKSEGPFRFWNPAELILVDASKKLPQNDNPTDSAIGEVLKVEVFDGKEFKPWGGESDENSEGPAPERFRLLTRVGPGFQRAAFGYYFEQFGEIKLP